ncbi:MAG: ABC transporter ATP-binding protein/permease [Clostridiales Family XIII bacterium]|jgi:putative ABC transport system permease protein|nr:ABC transporter ATP-binding protein/permease [Clostridiales Family XIII bacterium]
MLQVENICKQYTTGDLTQIALNNVSLNLRDSEFVAVLGPSGSGKTTLLNIIGGLDRYDSGEMIVSGVSTQKYKDRDWDSYRNHAIGFVFQSYNLIPHQSILSNVELALTISGVSKSERKKRAQEALEQVGLGDQSHKKPNQMSGGQMQRVAIARALVNNPDILLADEPTGALDTETSIQVLNLLKEVAKDRLVIMVTHNAELADEYASRIVKLRDGKIIDDSNPLEIDDSTTPEPEHRSMGKASMSFFMALALSLNNLMTKKTRTFLTAFAGSIGIIGIALILSLSSGMQAYIQSMQEDTLSTYPLQLSGETMDITGMMSAMMGSNEVDREGRDADAVYSSNIMGDLMKSVSAQISKNDLKRFKTYLESKDGEKIVDLTNTIQYGYDLDLQIYKADTTDGVLKVNPSNVFAQMTGGNATAMSGSTMGGSSAIPSASMSSSNPMAVMNSDIWTEMIGNDELLHKQYDVLAGKWPSDYNEVVLVVDENNELSDTVLYSLGILDQGKLTEMVEKTENGEEIKASSISSFSYDELIGRTFKLVINTDVFEKENGLWVDKSDKEAFMKPVINDALEIKIVGILRPNAELTATSISGSVAYLSSLNRYVVDKINSSEIVKEQQATPETNVFTGMPFDIQSYTENLTMDDVYAYLETLPETGQMQMSAMMQSMSEEEILSVFADMMRDSAGKAATYEDNLASFGVVDLNSPSTINIYPKNFEAKDQIAQYIEDYNTQQKQDGHDEYVISYSDIMAVMMSSVTSIVNIITYILIAFVAISLVVSSIMIGIITYISVLERTKEIGILRSIGASKRDISRVFNAETIIEGFVAGALGIGITLLLNIPINIIIKSLTGISGIAALPLYSALILILLSVVLNVIAGLFPSRVAAKKDPVIALRSE